METRIEIAINIIHAKIGYLLASLSSYSDLGLHMGISKINNDLDVIKESFMMEDYIFDTRKLVNLRDEIKTLENRLGDYNSQNNFLGHRLACQVFEISLLIKQIIIDFKVDNEEIEEFLLHISRYFVIVGNIINKELLYF